MIFWRTSLSILFGLNIREFTNLAYRIYFHPIQKMFSDVLKHNFWALSNINKIIYIVFIRAFKSKKDRLFFEGSFFLPGQMYKAERECLYEIIRDAKPDYCFEIGTYTGGGSTYFISEALKDNNKGRLFTIENNQFLYKKAINRYKKYIKNNYHFVDFIFSSSPTVFEKYLKEKDKKIMIFLDGAEESNQTLEQYNFFLPYLRDGTIMALHDWNTEKTIKVRPIINQDKHWVKIIELEKPESVGFAIFKYNKR